MKYRGRGNGDGTLYDEKYSVSDVKWHLCVVETPEIASSVQGKFCMHLHVTRTTGASGVSLGRGSTIQAFAMIITDTLRP